MRVFTRHLFVCLFILFVVVVPGAWASLPSTSNYQLNSYGLGSGGTANSTTSTYALEGISGETSGSASSTATYSLKPGFVETQQAQVPTVTLTNPSNYYDKLKFVLSQQNNPSDALYALQISTSSNFASNINYVKSDNTIGATLALTDYQTYTAWGGASGTTIIGLSSTTTYYIRAKATQGKFTESGYGPSSNAATIGQQMSFCLYTVSCGSASSVSFSGVVANSIASGSSTIKTYFDTNANSGGKMYVYSANGGLKSTHASNYTIGLSGNQVNLSSASEGFGAQSTATQTSGSLLPVFPYDGTPNTVGKLNTTISEIFTTSGPLVGGLGTTTLMLLTSSSTPSASDYADTLTFIAAAAF
jgi:hypothetical protein